MEEAVHSAAVQLGVARLPVLVRLWGRELRELERRVWRPAGVGLAVPTRRAVTERLHLWRVAEVVVERSILLAGDDEVVDRMTRLQLGLRPVWLRLFLRVGCGRPKRTAEQRDRRTAGPTQERAAGEGVGLWNHPLSFREEARIVPLAGNRPVTGAFTPRDRCYVLASV